MKRRKAWLALAAGWLTVGGAAAPAAAEPRGPETKTLSPYFRVVTPGGGDNLAGFPLEATDVEVKISGVIADVTVRQRYRNAGPDPIEAVYVFPASTRAAVHGLQMTVGDRVVKAVVQEREQARQTFEAAKAEGRSASLLEQQRPNVFQMNVANILPGDRIDVELRYTELLVPESGVYEFVYPTVVGPRYSNQPADTATGADRFVANPYLPKRQRNPTRLSLSASVEAGLPVQDVGSPSHAVQVTYGGPTRTALKLDPKETEPATRDFILRYRLQDASIQSGLLLDSGSSDASPTGTVVDERGGALPRRAEDRFFLLMVQPPRRVAPAEVPPREYIFIVDVSGSMSGFPLDTTKRLLHGLFGTLRPQDRFNVLLFAGGSRMLSAASVPATPQTVRAALEVIDGQGAGGGTELLPALDRALALPRGDLARSIVVVTDGYVDVEAKAFDRIRTHAGEASVYAFGIGSAVNRHLIEGLAHAGSGEPFIVTGPDHADEAARRFSRYVASPLLSEVEVDYGELDAYDVEPAVIPILTAERPLVVTGKWRGAARGKVTVRARHGDQAWTATVEAPAQSQTRNPGLRYLWAREKLRLLSDLAGPGDANKETITALGLRYNLLTRHTSFVAVDEMVRNTAGSARTVPQPLPLPQGVSELAVGTNAPGTPEPGTLLLLGVAGAAAARRLRGRRSRAS
jgi:Ca-activated chloride channel homolog